MTQTTITSTHTTIGPRRSTRTAMTPVSRTMQTTYIGGPDSGRTREECWSAVSLDGQWAYTRLEDEQTSWFVTHTPSGYSLELPYGSLNSARKSTHDGSTLRLMIAQENRK